MTVYAQYYARRAAGLCIADGPPHAAEVNPKTGRTRCRCRAHADEAKARILAYGQQLHAARKTKGLCVTCGERPPRKGSWGGKPLSTCYPCYEARAEKDAARHKTISAARCAEAGHPCRCGGRKTI